MGGLVFLDIIASFIADVFLIIVLNKSGSNNYVVTVDNYMILLKLIALCAVLNPVDHFTCLSACVFFEVILL